MPIRYKVKKVTVNFREKASHDLKSYKVVGDGKRSYTEVKQLIR